MILRSVLLGATTVAVCLATMTGLAGRLSAQSAVPPGSSAPAASDSVEAAQALVESSCQRCHNDRTSRGNLSLATFEVATADTNPEVSERMIRKLRAGMMPPPGGRRPEETALQHLAESLESRIDAGAIADPVPGRRTFQRLNRAEYERSIHDLLELAIDAGQYLPPDTKSANFDNIADAQLLSTTLMNGYLTAASEISRLAVGDRHATASEATYRVTRWASQRDHVEGAPYGTRGGIVVDHTFAADGDYVFRVSFHHETTGALYGSGRAALHTAEAPEQIEVSVDGERLALLDIDRWMHASDPDGVNIWTKPFHVTAGPHRVTAAFLRSFEGPLQDLISPHDWSLASTSIADAYGFTSLPHLHDLAIRGPSGPTSVSETPSRAAIFTCRPATPADEPACARAIISRLGARAYRRSLTSADVDALVAVYDAGRVDDFESGIRLALEGILASPHFVFRFEEPPAGVAPTSAFHVSGVDLASRLSFFLWSTGPDDELVRAAQAGELADPRLLEQQVRRMLADRRSEALATRFAGQWLRLQDLDGIHPNVRTYPDFDEQLRESMRRETELFFEHLVREDRNVLELFTADHTFVNERLATHYGIPNVVGSRFRRVSYPDDSRRGLLGHASVLTLTSHADRTSPVLRGKWVMEVLLGTPPPPPPPNIPDLEETAATDGGRLLSVRERMEAHRSNPTCRSCHRVIDPIGLALENYGVSGAWRIKDNGVPIDAAGEIYDGTPVASPGDLRAALLRRPTPIIRTFTENLMAYGLGRRLSHTDMPMLRAIVARAAADGNRISAFILGIIESPAFQVKGASPL